MEKMAIDIRIQLSQAATCLLGPRFPKALLFQEEVDAQVGICDGGLVEHGKCSNSRQNEVLQGLDADDAGTGVDQQHVGILKRGLAAGGPQPELSIIFAFL